AEAEADAAKDPSGGEAAQAQPAASEEGANEPGKKPEDEEAAKPKDAADPFLIRVQVLLDRAHASPGVIDGRSGGNTDKAVRAYEQMQGLKEDGALDEEVWSKLSADAGPAVKTYQLTKEDVAGPYVPELPSDYAEMAKLDRLAYRDAAEMLAERFHMDEALIRSLNPEADFKTEDQTILVADPGADPETKVDRIVVDKSKGELIAYAEDGRIVLMDPATIGSEDTPSPSGTMKVKGSAREPTYEYDPKKNFQQGKNRKKLTLPPGPNGPVGSVWIDLSKPTYGI
ncbi:L,D-transpeptidase family protein, partial [Aureimonas ureilytica]|uniref:L,D-transpeptidase family protein n=1 Tax=Aureimonas ureilytica TaxID=401562 RepID=UPI000734DAFF